MLAMQSVAKSFDGREVLHDVSLTVNRGETVGLLGPNGAGKTTAFHLLTGMLPVDRGRIMLDEFDITSMTFYDRARHGVTYLPQDPCIVRGLTVEQNLELVTETRNMTRDERRQLQESLLGIGRRAFAQKACGPSFRRRETPSRGRNDACLCA